MFEYQDSNFYTDYFNNNPNFKVIESFKPSEDKDEKNLYVGIVEVLNTIHPLKLRVEIPFTFPHNKLTFRTKSLSGYPHLIHSGKIKYGEWFCLNTPFAETADEQLNQEVMRLKEWINHQMKDELPPVIKDPKVRLALAKANAYEWENPDEVNEFASKAIVTLIGEKFKSASYFEKKQGYFYGVKSPDNRIYALKHKFKGEDYKLPYIIVKDIPEDPSILEDFIKMKNFYKWDESICEHLLPNTHYHEGKEIFCWNSVRYDTEYSLDEALSQIEEVKKELLKDESYLDKTSFSLLLSKNKDKNKVPTKYKNLILNELEKIRLDIIKDNGVQRKSNPWNRRLDEDEYDEEQAAIDQWTDHDQYIYDYFAVGFEEDNKIKWLIFFTNPASCRDKQEHYDVKVREICLNIVEEFNLAKCIPQFIDEKMFFGRGALNKILNEKRIALVGLGALGSMVAESLAHSGIKKIGLWDSDIVEPGNICRSSYYLSDLGESKVSAIKEKIISINPFIEIKDIKCHGYWDWHPNFANYLNGSFYDNINYKNQKDSLNELDDFDIIIDCTGSNEMLHFLSYSIRDKELISLCITNHANELVCTTNLNGNPFELRKAYLSRIAQDTKNYYVEGSGCYNPTFLAKYFDIAALINYFIRDFDFCSGKCEFVPSCIYSYKENAILKDPILSYKLQDLDIRLNISNETLLDAQEMFETEDSYIGYLLGSYSANGKEIMITNIIPSNDAKSLLEIAFLNSNGIIDYIGDFIYSDPESDSYPNDSLETIISKAIDPEININNPVLAIKHKDGSITFMLYINGTLIPFKKES